MTKVLKIGVDVRDLRIAKTGTKTYLEEVCNEFKKLKNPKYQFFFLDTVIPVYTGENKVLKLIEHFRYQLWKQIILPLIAWVKGCDIVFCTDNFVPYIHLGYQTVPVFHDAFFFEDPSHYNPIWLWVYKKLAVPAAARSLAIVVPTLYAKERIIYFTGFKKDKITVVYEGPKSFKQISDLNPSQLLKRLKLEPKKYILHVGVMNKRKNIPMLIRAFKKLKLAGNNEYKLVLTGNRVSKKYSNDYEEINNTILENNLQNDIIFTDYLNDDELSEIYKSALFYVFPSVNEGFGIPILESFKHEIPVIVAGNTCLPEVGGNAVLTFDPYSIDDLFSKMKLILDNKDLQEQLIFKGKERLKLFSWRQSALDLLLVFERNLQKY